MLLGPEQYYLDPTLVVMDFTSSAQSESNLTYMEIIWMISAPAWVVRL